MTARSVPEWIGASPDAAIPMRVKLRVFERHGGRCHLTGAKIKTGDAWECDHVKPIIMGGENRESNLAPALYAPHREKAAAETSAKSKADRIRAKHLGIWPKSKRPLKGRGFDKTRTALDDAPGGYGARSAECTKKDAQQHD